MKHSLVSFKVFRGLLYLWAACLLMDKVVFLVSWWFNMKYSKLELADFGWDMILVLRWRSLGELLPINVPWVLEFSGGLISWTQVSYLGDSTLTHYCSTNTPHPHNGEQKEKDWGGVGRKAKNI